MALKFSDNSATLQVFINLGLKLTHTHFTAHPYLLPTRGKDLLVHVDGNLMRHR